MRKVPRLLVLYLLLPVLLLGAASLAWIRLAAHRPLGEYFEERRGRLAETAVIESSMLDGQVSTVVQLRSDSGLLFSLRTIREAHPERPLPVLIVLGGHRTGSDAVDLFGHVGERAVVALDYPYEGPDEARSLGQVLSALPLARRAVIDTPPAVSLTLDWLADEDWANQDQLIIIGASLGVPFAAVAAARDNRIDGAILIHGAADNLLWLQAQVARRYGSRPIHRPLATLIHWLAYGPTFDTAKNVSLIAPRPVIVIGARNDERTPAGQTEALCAAARAPKRIRWTTGRHVEPDRHDIIAELLRIADEELPWLLRYGPDARTRGESASSC